MKISEDELEYRKNKIIQCAFQMFCKNGISNTSIRDLAKTSGVSVNSIFRYFNNKSDLLLRTQQFLWHKVIHQLLVPIDTGYYTEKNGYEQLCILLDGFETLYREHWGYLYFSLDYKLYLMQKQLTISADIYQSMIQPVRDAFTAALYKGRTDGSLLIEKNEEEVFYCIWSIMHGFVNELMLSENIENVKNTILPSFHLSKKLILLGLTDKNAKSIFHAER